MKSTNAIILLIFLAFYLDVKGQDPLINHQWSTNNDHSNSTVVSATNPFGDNVLLLETTADGGWRGFNFNQITIDHTKTYRFSFWGRFTDINPNSWFTHVVTKDSNGNNIDDMNRGGSVTHYKYIDTSWSSSSDMVPQTNTWYLFVGFINGSSDNNSYEGGIYDINGNLLEPETMQNTSFGSNANLISFSHYYKYETNVGYKAYTFDPRIEEVTNGDDSVTDLINSTSSDCSSNNLVQEYSINGTWASGASSITIDEGDDLVLSGFPNTIPVSITDPNGQVHGDDYGLYGVTASINGTYIIIDTSSGCSKNLLVTVNGSGGGNTTPGKNTLIPTVVTASSDDGNGPENLIDNNLDGQVSRWSANGSGEYATFDLGNMKNFDQVQIAFFNGDQRTNTFDVQFSTDGSNWTNVLTNTISQGNTLDFEDFNFNNQYARYVRYVGYGNSLNGYNSLTEFRINNNSTSDDNSGDSTPTSGDSPWVKNENTVSLKISTNKIAVGTGNVPSDFKMAIDGKLITEEVRVELSGDWPDYVFTEEYHLPSLQEIQKHIQEKGHLPNMPSAKEVEANGIELGEMNRLLLEKIEEQMLFILQLEKRIKNLEKK